MRIGIHEYIEDDRIEEYIRDNGIRKTAEDMNITHPFIVNCMMGRANLPFVRYIELCEYLGINPIDITVSIRNDKKQEVAKLVDVRDEK